VTTNLHDYRTYAHCPPFLLSRVIDISDASKAGFPCPMVFHPHAAVTILGGSVHCVESPSANRTLYIGKPGSTSYFGTITFLRQQGVGTIRAIPDTDWNVTTIQPRELLQVDYLYAAANGECRVILNVGESRYAV
jgi:hypothetical protein